MSAAEGLVFFGAAILAMAVWLLPVGRLKTADSETTAAGGDGHESPQDPTASAPIAEAVEKLTASAAVPDRIQAPAVSRLGPAGASSRSAFPMAIAIPVPISAATPLDPGPTPVLATADPVPVRRDAPFENGSARASSVTWSPRPTSDDAPYRFAQSWQGSSSILARVSAVASPALEDPVRRRLLLAAGAGLAVAIAVAVRR